MLKQRIFTAIVLVATLLAALFAPNPIFWQIMISVMLTLGFYEWLKFCEIEAMGHKVAAFFLFFALGFSLDAGFISLNVVIAVVCTLWCALLAFTVIDIMPFFHAKLVKLLTGVVTLAVAGWLIIIIRELDDGLSFVMGFFLCVIAADVGAYFSGKRFGKTKLAPTISPGKTVEGFLGGLGLVVVIFVPILFYKYSSVIAAGLLLTVILTAIVSVGGDLFESKLKRYVGLKDSSQILPGHGGVLDRVDSLMAGVPVFALGLLLLGFFD